MHHKHLPHDHGNISNELLASIPDEKNLESISELFRLMSDTGRAKTFFLLCHCEECVINISAMLDVSPSATSQRLKALKESGLVTSRREGKEVYYTAAKTPRAHALHEMLENMLELACPSDPHDHAHKEIEPHASAVKEIHALITSDLGVRYTIDELSRRFHINKTSLKSAFKIAYGKPIAAYMKEYRIKRSMELLSHTDTPISEIASTVGYESSSKFTEAFKDVAGMTPMNYRKK